MGKLTLAKRKGTGASPAGTAAGFKILIVDDEPDVHLLTKSILRDFTLDGRGLLFFDAYGAADALRLLREHPDTALVLLDVVMEEEDSGLQVARRIRGELDNPFVRIVLRTGQPGQAPEEEVIVGYDINDYKEKTELTAKKLFTLMYSALRAYRDLVELERNRAFVHTLLEATGLVLGTVDGQGRIGTVTPTLEKLTRYPLGELKGRRVWELMVLPEEAREMERAFLALMQDPSAAVEPRVFSAHLGVRDQRHRLVFWSNTALRKGGEAGFVIMSGADLTE